MENRINATLPEPTFNEWEQGIAEALAELEQIGYQDAMDIIEANPFRVAQSWAAGHNPAEAAANINKF